MGETADAWRKSVGPHFDYLIGWGFATVLADDTSNWQTWVDYRSPTAAVRIVRSFEFQRVELALIRLNAGVVPRPRYQPRDFVLFDNVVEGRDPGHRLDDRATGGLDPPAVERQLEFWAHALQTFALDFLAGDLAALDDGAHVVEERVRRNPWPP